MKIHGGITIGKRTYIQGDDVPWYAVYPFFLLHMLMFGASGFLMAYAKQHPPVGFLYAHGGIAIIVYTIFYLALFGRDEVKWMFINAGLGLLGICSQIGWLLAFAGRRFSDYPWYVHVVPLLYFVLYTFLIRQAVLDIMRAREDEGRRRMVERCYVVITVALYAACFFLEGR